jgi:hypothetical protein
MTGATTRFRDKKNLATHQFGLKVRAFVPESTRDTPRTLHSFGLLKPLLLNALRLAVRPGRRFLKKFAILGPRSGRFSDDYWAPAKRPRAWARIRQFARIRKREGHAPLRFNL